MVNWDDNIMFLMKLDLTLFMDANNLSWGVSLNHFHTRGFWTSDLMQKQINYCKLTAVFLAFLAFKDQICSTTVFTLIQKQKLSMFTSKMGFSPTITSTHHSTRFHTFWTRFRRTLHFAQSLHHFGLANYGSTVYSNFRSIFQFFYQIKSIFSFLENWG